MAEAARRMGYGHGSEVVRRLIARPIRLQAASVGSAFGETPQPGAPAETGERPESVVTSLPGPPDGTPDTQRLRTEMLLLKAVLQAERRENASLRACVGLDEADAGLTPETRAMRDRWAALVDRLLHAAV